MCQELRKSDKKSKSCKKKKSRDTRFQVVFSHLYQFLFRNEAQPSIAARGGEYNGGRWQHRAECQQAELHLHYDRRPGLALGLNRVPKVGTEAFQAGGHVVQEAFLHGVSVLSFESVADDWQSGA